MVRLHLAAFALLVVFAGCAPTTTTTIDPALQNENADLKQKVSSLETEKTGMQKELLDKEGAISKEKMESEQWRKKYEAAKDSVPAGEMVPADLMKAFVDIARAGGPWEVGSGGTLKTSSDVFFDSGKTELKPAGQNALREIVPKLKEILADKRVMLAVEGHTDNTPIVHAPFKDNRHLSLMRAHAVVTFLNQLGVPAAEMSAVGYGEYHPVASNATADSRSKNRRVELRLITSGSAAPAVAPAPAPEVPIGS